MSFAIRVENLSKRYRIQHAAERVPYRTLRDDLVRAATAPLRWLRGQRSRAEDFWALKDVSFEVQQGEVLGIIGRNGAGKSTLLKILSRITKPTSGVARIRGRVGSLLEVGTGFHPELTGRENIYLSGAVLGMSRGEIQRKFDEIVDFAEIEKFLDTPAKRYSSGMYMRLAFAVAAHLEPEVLLVDEVLAVGDVAFQQKCLGKMSAVAQTGRTVLFVSHNMAAVANLCQRGLVMEKGREVFSGPCRQAVEHYVSLLAGNSEQNLSEHVQRVGDGSVRFTRIWFEDENQKRIDQPVSGNELDILLAYQSSRNDTLRNCCVAVVITDVLQQILFICSTEMSCAGRIDLPPNGVVRCVIPRLPLTQGRYWLTLYFEVNREAADWLTSAVPMDVIDGDFFGTGRQYPVGFQGIGVMVPFNWRLPFPDKAVGGATPCHQLPLDGYVG